MENKAVYPDFDWQVVEQFEKQPMKSGKSETANDKAVNTRIPTDTWKWLTSMDTAGGAMKAILFEAKRSAELGVSPYDLSSTLENLMMVRKRSQAELKGMFTADEWSLMADSLNGTIATPEFRCIPGALIAGLEDSDLYENVGARWGVDVKALCEKIKPLTGAQIDAIFSRVEAFWNDEKQDLKEWSMW